MNLLLDTHVAIWIGNKEPLARAAQQLIDKALTRDTVFVSAISAWEITMLALRNRIDVTLPVDSWFARFMAATGFASLPVTPECAVDAALLPDIHRDPADRFLIATARLLDLTLVTRDRNIRKYGEAGYVRIAVC